MTDALTPSPTHRRKLPASLLIVAGGLIVIGSYVGAMALAPMPAVSATPVPLTVNVSPRSAIAWPGSGQAAIGVNGSGVVATNGAQVSVPIASIAKTVLALEIMEKQPMKVGETGTTITFTDADEQLYRDKIKENQSVVPVAVDEKLTEYQALQALLLPSGNNIADSLAIRGFGSVADYLIIANKQLADWGLKDTHLDDASGFSEKTVSSAHDLVLIGEKVLANPVLADIVKQSDVTLPVAGEEHNVNTLLGQDGIIGIKTGNTDQAGGCFLFAVQPKEADRPVIIGAFLGQKDLPAVLAATTSFIEASAGNFAPVTVTPAGATVATIAVPWGGKTINAVTKTAATIVSPTSDQLSTSVSIRELTTPTAKLTTVGSLQAKAGSLASETPVVVTTELHSPSLVWKLLHPLPEFRAITRHLKQE